MVPELSANGLTCIKRDRVLFENLSFSLHAGELVYLRGPNGAGKTSLLRILTGLSMPSSGCVQFRGETIASSEDFAASVIYIGHKSALNGAFTAIENLYFWSAQQGLAPTQGELFNCLDRLGLVGLEEIPVKFLSAGQQRRVALSRLWLKQAPLWVLDEPFTALDTQGVALLEAAFASHTNDGGAVLTTSHQALSPLAGTIRHYDLEYRI